MIYKFNNNYFFQLLYSSSFFDSYCTGKSWGWGLTEKTRGTPSHEKVSKDVRIMTVSHHEMFIDCFLLSH